MLAFAIMLAAAMVGVIVFAPSRRRDTSHRCDAPSEVPGRALPSPPWLRPVRTGWLAHTAPPGPSVDGFASDESVIRAFAEGGALGAGPTLLDVQYPHLRPELLAAGGGIGPESIGHARAGLAHLLPSYYTQVAESVLVGGIQGPDGELLGLLCEVDLSATDEKGRLRIRSTEAVDPHTVQDRTTLIAGTLHLTSAPMLVPTTPQDDLSPLLAQAVGSQTPEFTTQDGRGRVHRYWRVAKSSVDQLLQVAAASTLLVADGNHRVAALRGSHSQWALAFVTAGPDLRISTYPRALRGTGRSGAELIQTWRAAGLRPRRARGLVPRAGSVVAVTATGAVEFDLRQESASPAPWPGVLADMQRLLVDSLGETKAWLEPALPTDAPGELPAGADALILAAAPTRADLSLALEHCPVLPYKSVYFAPKPLSGHVVTTLSPVPT